MAEKSTVARPYAQAAFELAREQNNLAGWSGMLAFAATVTEDPAMQRYIDNPQVDQETLTRLMLSVCEDVLNNSGMNFLRVLIENRRLGLLPEICALYEKHRADAENRIEAEVISAFPLSEAQQQALAEGLKRRLGREVSLLNRVDEKLIGGAIVRAGDLVIDGSVTGKLDKLAYALMH